MSTPPAPDQPKLSRKEQERARVAAMRAEFDDRKQQEFSARVAAEAAAETDPAITAARKATLSDQVALRVRGGWTVETQTDYQAVISKKKKPNHLLHLLLTIFTLGAWGIIWIYLAVTAKTARQTITVDAAGQIKVQ
jgi:Na+-transporting NADH:ubiquinone oxidoreductase subunit NqrC